MGKGGKGFQVKEWGAPLDVSNVSPHELKEISEGTGVVFPISADSRTGRATTVPESVVVNVEKEKE